MPFKSKAQQRWMFATHPEMAKEWADHTPDFSKLPEKKKPSKDETGDHVSKFKQAADELKGEKAPTDKDRTLSSIPLIGGLHSAVSSPSGHGFNRTGLNILAGQLGGTLGGDRMGEAGGELGYLAGNYLGSKKMLDKYDKEHFEPEEKKAADLKETGKKLESDDKFPGGTNTTYTAHGPVHIAHSNMQKGKKAALKQLGIKGELKKEAGMMSTLGKGVMGLGKMTPGIGTAFGAASGAMQGYANGEGVTGMLGRGAMGAATGSMGVGSNLLATGADMMGVGPSALGDKLFGGPKPTPPSPSMLPAGPQSQQR